MKLNAVRIWVDDFSTAKTFYEDVLRLPLNWEAAEIGAAGFAAGPAELIVEEARDEEGRALTGRFVGVSLRVDDIADQYDALRAVGVAFEGPPEKQSWGGTLAHFKDPSGNVLTLLG